MSNEIFKSVSTLVFWIQCHYASISKFLLTWNKHLHFLTSHENIAVSTKNFNLIVSDIENWKKLWIWLVMDEKTVKTLDAQWETSIGENDWERNNEWSSLELWKWLDFFFLLICWWSWWTIDFFDQRVMLARISIHWDSVSVECNISLGMIFVQWCHSRWIRVKL